MNLRGVDLNLLTVFEAVYEERNQASAAERLAMTQPAVSNAITRLRQVVKDRLFVARAKGVHPTPLADRLYGQVHRALELIRLGVADVRDFDPATTERSFTLAVSYGGGVVLAAAFYRWLKREAPQAKLRIRALDSADEIPRLLHDGRIDLTVDYVRFDDRSLVHEELMETRLVVIASSGHPRIRNRLTRSMFEQEAFASHFETHTRNAAPELEQTLSKIKDRVVIEVPTALALPAVVSQTDLIAVVSEQIAALTASRYGLNIFPLPFPAPPVPAYLIWHRSREHDSGHVWLRAGVKEIVSQFGPPQVLTADAEARQ